MKHTFYKAINTRNKKPFPDNVRFDKAHTQHIVEITDSKGNKFNFALEYDRSFKEWYATELTTGMGSKPLTGKTRLDLVTTLSKLDLTRALCGEYADTLRAKLREHIESEDSE